MRVPTGNNNKNGRNKGKQEQHRSAEMCVFNTVCLLFVSLVFPCLSEI